MTIYGRACNANAPPRLMYHNLDAVAATRAPLRINVRAYTRSMSVSFWEKGQVMKQPMLLQAVITHGRAREIERDMMCRQRYSSLLMRRYVLKSSAISASALGKVHVRHTGWPAHVHLTYTCGGRRRLGYELFTTNLHGDTRSRGDRLTPHLCTTTDLLTPL